MLKCNRQEMNTNSLSGSTPDRLSTYREFAISAPERMVAYSGVVKRG